MFNKFILVVGALFFLASCDTATQDAVKSSADKAGKASATAKAGSASIFGSAKEKLSRRIDESKINSFNKFQCLKKYIKIQ